MEILSKEETAAALAGPHCFSGINFQCKASSKTQKLRVVTNSSSYHASGSLNSHIPRGGNLIGGLKNIFQAFRLGKYIVLFDLSRAYRSIFSSPATNNLRLMWCWASVEKANKDLDEAMVVFRLLRMTFGDQSASAFLELALREIVAPLCKTALGREMLQSTRYVDDGARAHHNKAELHEAMDDVINTL